jgi:hypothetical protein
MAKIQRRLRLSDSLRRFRRCRRFVNSRMRHAAGNYPLFCDPASSDAACQPRFINTSIDFITTASSSSSFSLTSCATRRLTERPSFHCGDRSRVLRFHAGGELGRDRGLWSAARNKMSDAVHVCCWAIGLFESGSYNAVNLIDRQDRRTLHEPRRRPHTAQTTFVVH